MIPTPPPRLETEHLVLRALRLEDFEPFFAFVGDPASPPFAPAPPMDRRLAWRSFASSLGTWFLFGAGWWAIEDRATGELAGTVGAFFRETQLPLGPESEIEVGWNVFPRFARRGYATEAARAVIADAFARHRVPRVFALTAPHNTASQAVARKLGMTRADDVDFYGEPSSKFVLDRPG